ncbi:MAG: glutathione-dependent formaldehyde dehydrogenase [Candidatus Eremiobacteraeota bacterium]|nr:glutathione-dependent formaldehyde dehydrogenase [Candidatus Eremiobacteraeota bacterium]
MKAIVFHGVGDIRLDDVPEPKIKDEYDAIVRITASAICGTDLHFVRGSFSDVEPGTILGHEGVGVIEELGKGVRNMNVGDRVVIPSTIACGSCSYCRSGWYSKCDNANPNGPLAGTAFYGGPKATGPFDGLQAEYARVPYANVGLVKLPSDVSDDQAILLSDIFTTGYFGADMAGIKPGHTVAVFGCGPVGQFVIASAQMLGAGRVFAIDNHKDRLRMACAQGAEVIDFTADDPVKVLRELTGGSGPDSVVDAVGIDAVGIDAMSKRQSPHEGNWKPGDAPSQVLEWAVDAVAKGGHISIIGVYPPTATTFPIGKAMAKNATIRSGDCPHRRYLFEAVSKVSRGDIDPQKILTEREPISDAIEAYKAFDARSPGWIKVELLPTTDRGRVTTGVA